MGRTWLSVTVELLGGRGEELWPWPGRVFAVGPSHTFKDLADAVNDAFARWDRAHLSMFILADGRVVTDVETGTEMAGSSTGPIRTTLDIEATTVARVLDPEAEFQFTFDLGDNCPPVCGRRGEGRPGGGAGHPSRQAVAVLGVGHHPGPVRPQMGGGRW